MSCCFLFCFILFFLPYFYLNYFNYYYFLFELFKFNLSVLINLYQYYIYIYISTSTHTHTNIYIYRERERELNQLEKYFYLKNSYVIQDTGRAQILQEQDERNLCIFAERIKEQATQQKFLCCIYIYHIYIHVMCT